MDDLCCVPSSKRKKKKRVVTNREKNTERAPRGNMILLSNYSGNPEWHNLDNIMSEYIVITDEVVENEIADIPKRLSKIEESIQNIDKDLKSIIAGNGTVEDIEKDTVLQSLEQSKTFEQVERSQKLSIIYENICFEEDIERYSFVSINNEGNLAKANSSNNVIGVIEESVFMSDSESMIKEISLQIDNLNSEIDSIRRVYNHDAPTKRESVTELFSLMGLIKQKNKVEIAIRGVMTVTDNGECSVGGRCVCDDGIAIPLFNEVFGMNSKTWMILSRVDANKIDILL